MLLMLGVYPQPRISDYHNGISPGARSVFCILVSSLGNDEEKK